MALNKNLALINFIIVAYFVMIWLVYYFKIDFILVGVFQELLTIPFMLAQIVFLVLGVIYLFNKNTNKITVISILALFICTHLTVGSFFIKV